MIKQILFKIGDYINVKSATLFTRPTKVLCCALGISLGSLATQAQPVAIHGSLSISGNKVVNKNGQPVSFGGNSFFWSNNRWGGEKYYTASVVSWLRNDWNSGIVRCAMGVEEDGGYISDRASNKARVKTVVDAAIANGMYVIIDWHTHKAESYTNEAIAFFKEMAQTYGDQPNVIYEVYNEPIYSSWSGDIKPYAEKVIDAIRSIDPDNLIIVGTRFYSAMVNEPADDPIQRKNIAYTIHFYAAEHQQTYRDRCQYALNKGIALFATEWGTVFANGGGNVNEGETYAWIDFMKRNHISHCNWSINDKQEGASALNSGASTSGNWSSNNLTWSGGLVRNILRSYDYGTAKDEVGFEKAPIIAEASTSYVFKISYVATQNRDLIVSLLDKSGNLLATSKTSVTGIGTKEVVLDLNQKPSLGGAYSYVCELRPIGGNAQSSLDKKTIANVSFTAQRPTTIIEAEDYSAMSKIETEPCEEGGASVGYIDTGDWMSYDNVTIPVAGTYIMYYRVASKEAQGVISLEKDAGKTILGTINVPNTGGWQTWRTISHEVDLPSGTYSIGLGVPSGGYNLNQFAIVSKQGNIVDVNDTELSNAPELGVYPSTAYDVIHIHKIIPNTSVYIVNSQGQVLLSTTNSIIDISSFPKGLYMATDGTRSGRFAKE